jgi:hypothetical protein
MTLLSIYHVDIIYIILNLNTSITYFEIYTYSHSK